MRKLNWLWLPLFIVNPMGWIMLYMDYTIWVAYKKHKFNVPDNFFIFWFERNFNQNTSYFKRKGY